MGKLDHVKDRVVKSLAVGEPQTNIAEQIGVDNPLSHGLLVKMRIDSLLKNKRGS